MEITDDSYDNKNRVLDKLRERDAKRLASIAEKKKTEKSKSSENENVDKFIEQFNRNKMKITATINVMNSDSFDKEMTKKTFEKVNMELDEMKAHLASSSHFLPSFNAKTAQDSLKELLELIESSRVALMPQKKFGFKKRAPQKPKDEIDLISSKKQNTAKRFVDETEIFGEFLGLKLGNEIDKKLQLDSELVLQKEIQIINLTNCSVSIFGAPNTVHIKNLVNCHTSIGPTTTSIFISDCINCTFQVACQQLRIHRTKNSVFRIQVTSRAIIEDCHGLTFGPYDFDYDGIKDDFSKAMLDPASKNWTQIDDFNWLVKSSPSPNWNLISQ